MKYKWGIIAEKLKTLSGSSIPPELQAEYRSNLFIKYRPHMRATAVIAMVSILAFLPVDIFVMGVPPGVSALLRAGAVIPIWGIFYAVVSGDKGPRWGETALIFAVTATALLAITLPVIFSPFWYCLIYYLAYIVLTNGPALLPFLSGRGIFIPFAMYYLFAIVGLLGDGELPPGAVLAVLMIMTSSMLLSLIAFIINRRNEESQWLYHRQLTASNEELLQAKKRAEDATATKDKFVSLVSHDLRGPLASVRSLTALLAKRMDAGEDAKPLAPMMGRVTASCDALLEMIDQLLDITRLNAGTISVVKKTVKPRALAESKIMLFLDTAREKGVTLKNELPEAMRMPADPSLLGEVLGNLISNALKFSRSGGTIRVFAPESAGNCIAVSDTGTGIKPELLENLFRSEIKTTSIGTGGEKGHGLGLPYCMDIMKAHGGNLEVESAVGRGSTFFARLPATRLHVLVVDDTEFHRRSMKEIIRRLGNYEVMEAENGRAALEEVRHGIPSLIISDLQMPIMSGFDFITALKREPAFLSIPVIVATAQDSQSANSVMTLKDQLFALGVTDFVSKPIVEADFIPRIKRFL